MEEHLAFIKTILNDPVERTAKLVYADWLEEHEEVLMPCHWCAEGEPRGGCSWCKGQRRVPMHAKAARAQFIRISDLEIVQNGFREWSWFRSWFNDGRVRLEYRDGFVRKAICSPVVWISVAEQLVWRKRELEPKLYHQPLEEVELTGEWPEFAALPKTGLVDELARHVLEHETEYVQSRASSLELVVRLFTTFWPTVKFTWEST